MKPLKRFLIGLIVLLVLGIGVLYLTGNSYILKGLRIIYLKGYTTVYIDDWPYFDNRTIEAGDSAATQDQTWPKAENYNTLRPTDSLDHVNTELGTIAFLIIKNDSLLYEDYSGDYGTDSKTNSYSMAKSITVALLGKALKQGVIKNLDQPVADFYPQFDERLSVGDLASMASGLNWSENYHNPFSSVAKLYLDKDIRQLMLDHKVVDPPGEEFKYLSGNTELLGMVIEKATGGTLTDYLSENFWQPMGMQHDALWELDSKENGMEKTYCCISSNARDFARFGKLFKDCGNWHGRQLLDSAFVAKTLQPRFEDSPQYGYGFWLSHHRDKSIFAMRGLLGQYVIVIPEDDLIIVRLGHHRMGKQDDKHFTEDFYIYIDQVYKMLNTVGNRNPS